MKEKINIFLDVALVVLLLFMFLFSALQICDHDSENFYLLYLNYTTSSWNLKTYSDFYCSDFGFKYKEIEINGGIPQLPSQCLCYKGTEMKGEEMGKNCKNDSSSNWTCLIQSNISTTLSPELSVLIEAKETSLNYFDYLKRINVSTGNCTSEYESCKGFLDSLNNTICIKKGETTEACPITTLKINDDEEEAVENRCESSYEEGKNILVEFFASMDTPCINPYEFNYSSAGFWDYDSKCSEEISNTKIDDRYTKFYEKDFGKVLAYTYEGFRSDYWESPRNRTIGLYSKSYQGLDLKCLQKKNKAPNIYKSLNFNEKFERYKRSNISHQLYLIFVVLGFLSFCFHLFLIITKDYKNFIRYETSLCMMIALFGFFSSSMIMTFTFQGDLFLSIDYGCGDKYLNEVFQKTQYIYNKWKFYNIVMFILGIIVGVLAVIRENFGKELQFEDKFFRSVSQEISDLEDKDSENGRESALFF